jgi:hypothetical protein
MDPLSITTGIAALRGTCLKTAISLEGLRSKYQTASLTIAALCSESTLISAALTQMQTLLLQNGRVQSRLDLLQTFDTSLTACMVIFSCLEQEIQKLSPGASPPQAKFSWRTKVRYLWNEDTMKEYLSLIRGQQSSLSFLIQLLQMQSIEEVYQQVKDNTPMLEEQASRAESLRQANPTTSVPGSVLGVRRGPESIFGDAASSIAATEFEFDDLLVNSKAYRRAMQLARTAVAKNTVPEKLVAEQADLDESAEAVSKSEESTGDATVGALKSLSIQFGATDTETDTIVAANESSQEIDERQDKTPDTAPSSMHITTSHPWVPSQIVAPVELDPRTIAFPRPFNRIVIIGVLFRNFNPGPVIFNVKVTAPRDYCVRPTWGYIPANDSRAIVFQKEIMNELPPDDLKMSKDKFLIQSFAAPEFDQYASKASVSKKISELVGNEARLVQEVMVRIEYLPEGTPPLRYTML